MAAFSGFQSGLNSLLMGAGIWTLLYLSIPLVLDGTIKGIYLAVILLGAMASFEAVQNLPQAAQLLEANLQSAKRLFEIADSVPAVCDPANPISRPVNATLQISGLRFSYEDEQTLKGIGFDLPAGKKIAIVGPSGAGKSTIVNLLMRYWEFSEGEITLDGKDIRLYNPVDVRRMFSVVTQGTYLFNSSLYENLRLANPSASKSEIEEACRQAEVHEFINSLPKGYDTLVGERGIQLSGGEKQRIAIARAILKNAPIFIFDEPTANLDPATEERLVETLLKRTVWMGRNASILWITHRLTGLENMDEILVMDKGCIVERGTHAELLKLEGLYWKLWGLTEEFLIHD